MAERRAQFNRRFLEDLHHWVANDRKTALRLLDIVNAVVRQPFEGIARPERLRRMAGNTWSRRLTEADRIVYTVYDDYIDFLQARLHYE